MARPSKISKRILTIAKLKGFKNIARLSAHMGYNKPERFYRFIRDPLARPAYDMIENFAITFPDLNIRWFVTGEGKPFEVEAPKK